MFALFNSKQRDDQRQREDVRDKHDANQTKLMHSMIEALAAITAANRT